VRKGDLSLVVNMIVKLRGNSPALAKEATVVKLTPSYHILIRSWIEEKSG